jgi:hypothetical protein
MAKMIRSRDRDLLTALGLKRRQAVQRRADEGVDQATGDDGRLRRARSRSAQ